MRCSLMFYALAVVLALTMVSSPPLSLAQAVAGATDFRVRGSYSAEDLAQALFPQETPALKTRGIGPPQARPSLPVPRAMVTLNVLFASNSAVLPSTSYPEVDKLGTILSWPQYAAYRIQLAGHTDGQGSPGKNQVLSERRVQSMKNYLIEHVHIAPERVQTVGYGASRPIASNDTPEGRSQNRRVEVVNLGHEE